MRKMTMMIAALGLLSGSVVPAMADQMPPGMKDVPAHQHKAKKPKKHRHPARSHPMPGGQTMEGGHMMQGGHMMHGDSMPMPMPTPSPTPTPMKSGASGCC